MYIHEMEVLVVGGSISISIFICKIALNSPDQDPFKWVYGVLP